MTKPQRIPERRRWLRQSVFATLQEKITAFCKDLIALHIGDTYLDPPAGMTNTGDDDAIARYGKVPGLIDEGGAFASRAAARGMSHIEGPTIHVGCGCTHALFCAVRGAQSR